MHFRVRQLDLRHSEDQPNRPKVLVFCDFYFPGYKAGGPVTTLRNVVRKLSNRFEFQIVTRDHDLGETTPYENVELGNWTSVEGVETLYLADQQVTMARLRGLLANCDPDFVYINSVWSRRFAIMPLLAVRTAVLFGGAKSPKVILAPRGSFSKGALGLKARRKKWLGLIARMTGFWNGIRWQASSAFEKSDICDFIGAQSEVMVAPDLPGAMPEISKRPEKVRREAKIVFLSRISPMKNLLGALELLAQVSGDVTFEVYGPKEDLEYWERCSALAADLPGHVRFRYCGIALPDAVPGIFTGADAFLLPTLGENFGHVILEALSSGCPVILSDRTPWRNLQHHSAGWDVPLDNSKDLVAAIQQVIEMDEAEHKRYRNGARALATSTINDPQLLASNVELFRLSQD